MATIEQKIAQKEAELARLKMQARKLETGQKVIIGGMILSIARREKQRAEILLNDIQREVTKKTDLDRLQPILDELQEIVNKAREDRNRHI